MSREREPVAPRGPHDTEPAEQLPERDGVHRVRPRWRFNLRRMRPTLPTASRPAHLTFPRSGKVRDVARALGCSEDTAKKRLYGAEAVNLQTAAILTVLLRRGDAEDAAAFEAPVMAAMMGPVPDSLTEVQRACDESDGFEDVAQAAWIATKTDEALDAYARKLAADLFYGSRLLTVLKAEQRKRREAT